jgi:hypothetical protein
LVIGEGRRLGLYIGIYLPGNEKWWMLYVGLFIPIVEYVEPQ